MGPRSNERGNAPYIPTRDSLLKLQWGRVRMNAEMACKSDYVRKTRPRLQWGRVRMNAEIVKSNAPLAAGLMLQWGRVRMNAEIFDARGRPRWRGVLQWGRVRMNAEISSVGPEDRLPAVASMGPRSDERGNQAGALETELAEALQWGRVRMNAEMPL